MNKKLGLLTLLDIRIPEIRGGDRIPVKCGKILSRSTISLDTDLRYKE